MNEKLKNPPTDRPAYSDRRAYLCAWLSEYAYKPFDDNSFIVNLEAQGFRGIRTFSKAGAEAFLCVRKEGRNKVAFLVFRGTNKNKMTDIKADLRLGATEVEVDGQKVWVHTGFHRFFELIKDEIQTELDRISPDQLFITGHSLGGAMAQVATLIEYRNINGACYVFGSPPVGYLGIDKRVKTPIYGIVNQSDLISRLPNPYLGWFLIILSKILTIFTWNRRIEHWAESLASYRTVGTTIYLIENKKGVHLRSKLPFFKRLRLSVADHGIEGYIKRLEQIALDRL